MNTLPTTKAVFRRNNSLADQKHTCHFRPREASGVRASSAPLSDVWRRLYSRTSSHNSPSPSAGTMRLPGFSLLELLLVLTIIGLLAALLLPVLSYARSKVQLQKARSEISDIVTAIHRYESTYGRLPAPGAAIKSANFATEAEAEDFTYGAYIQGDDGGAVPLKNPGAYFANNSDLMAMLLDLEKFGNGTPTVNKGHVLNARRITFLHARMTGDTNSPGIGPDGVYRDPWGGLYIISLDLNGDGTTRDALYRRPAVSADPADPNQGLKGLIKKTDAVGNPVFEVNGNVAVWSPGPGNRVGWKQKADEGDNKNNILSWQ